MKHPKYGFGAVLESAHGFVGRVDVIYEDLVAAESALAIPEGWFDMQEIKPSSKTQVFYGIVGLDGRGAALVGEDDVEKYKTFKPILVWGAPGLGKR